jgi:phage tail protein X
MARYDNPNTLTTSQGKPYYKGKYYPTIPLSENDIYVITTVSDRLDLLAYRYYNDTSLWWIIAAANNNINKGLLFITPGTQIRIPTDVSKILELFNTFNTVR